MYISQHCCDKTMDDKMASYGSMLFSELYKIMVNKVTFRGFKGGSDCPNCPTLDSPMDHDVDKVLFTANMGAILLQNVGGTAWCETNIFIRAMLM